MPPSAPSAPPAPPDPAPPAPPAADPADRPTVISIRGLKKSFGDRAVLCGVDLEVKQAENLVVLGRSGSGKSVLIKIVSENLSFPLTMNVKGLKPSEVQERVKDALDAVGLASSIHQMPSELSGGQRQRIGIARTLILRPEIMLYDEPTAGLDPVTSAEINELIRSVQARYHTASIIITHDLTCALNTGDRVAMLLDGAMIRTGTFASVFDTTDTRVKQFYDYNFTQDDRP